MSSPSISNIDDDCLLMIFDAMTRLMSTPFIPQVKTWPLDEIRCCPLNVIRTASQVCRRWRLALLGSPWIWGRLIDLDVMCLGRKRFRWLDEVVRRAGSALLWISGNVFDSSHSLATSRGLWATQELFVRLLESWERIEKLRVVINGKTIPDSIQNRFLCRSPNLKNFSVRCSGLLKDQFTSRDTLPLSSFPNLFADYAPSLRVINADDIGFKTDSSWLSTITRMDPIPRHFTTDDVFLILQRAPMLKEISLWHVGTPRHLTLPCPIHLPNLTTLECIGGSLEAIARFLDLLLPGPISYCWIISNDHSGPIPQNILTLLKKTIPRLISNYFTANPSTHHVRINVDPSSFKFSAISEHRHDYHHYHSNFFLRVPMTLKSDDQLMACLIDALSAAPYLSRNLRLFNSVNTLQLSLENPNEDIFSNIDTLLAAFQNIRRLEVYERSDKTLSRISSPNQRQLDDVEYTLLFPALQTLYLAPGGSDEYANPCTAEALLEFLLERKNIGVPVSRLDLTAKGPYHFPRDLRVLEQVKGLEVIWNNKRYSKMYRYICGSGEPQWLEDILQ